MAKCSGIVCCERQSLKKNTTTYSLFTLDVLMLIVADLRSCGASWSGSPSTLKQAQGLLYPTILSGTLDTLENETVVEYVPDSESIINGPLTVAYIELPRSSAMPALSEPVLADAQMTGMPAIASEVAIARLQVNDGNFVPRSNAAGLAVELGLWIAAISKSSAG